MNVCCPANGFSLADEYSSDPIAAYMSMLSSISRQLSSTVKFIEDFLVELAGLPEPSSYAHLSTWRVWQEKSTAILNLRPPTKQGLPIEVLHPAFATFLQDIKSMQLDKWAPEDNINSTSIKLCKAMAGSFDNEVARRKELIALLNGFGLDLQIEFCIEQTLPLETHSAQPDLHLSAGGRTVLLGEPKAEFETADPYMQVSRSYQALVHNLMGHERASDGVPCILLAICGQ